MIFTSFTFLIFVSIVLLLYHALSHKGQNLMLLLASYIFYGWWDWRFTSLLLFSTVIDYGVGLGLVSERLRPYRKLLLTGSIVIQLGLLALFKYYDFFALSLSATMAEIGWRVDPWLLRVTLPVGISFYTFHTLSYTIDIYKGKFHPTRDFVAFALFISFFPQLVAGPIARAKHLLPQMLAPRRVTWHDWQEGCYLFYWGLFKKVVVADGMAAVVNQTFAAPNHANAGTLLVAMYAFAWQIYCDFSGYTDMARGCARWFGVELQVNFDVPYVSIQPSEFWQRWHISLSSLLRDYLYIPLGGNRRGPIRTYANLVTTMLLGGLWHGANWTFVLWGLYHGLLLVAYRLVAPDLSARVRSVWLRIVLAVLFFHFVCVGWLIFRAESVTQLVTLLGALGRPPSLSLSALLRLSFAIPVFLLELPIARWKDQLAFLRFPAPLRAAVYVCVYWSLLTVGDWGGQQFIYFQF